MFKLFKTIFPVIISYTLKIILAGLIIGLLYRRENLLVIILALVLVYKIYKLTKDKSTNIRLLIPGMLLTGFLGVVIEYFGTKLNYWEYHHISGQLPRYLLIVWMFAFMFMYNIEKKIFLSIENITPLKRKVIILFIVIVFPTIGEIVCINLGVWTYYYPYIFLGVSPYTIFYIALVHIIINYFISIYLKKKNIKDIVLNP